LNNLLKN
uniref:Uncharacterized protein n=1 Tax=Amphimedon queenslandica TaxID=400682 RepID=A0A5K1XT96_AMPQE